MPAADFSKTDLGSNHVKNADNLFTKPVITSGFLANMPSKANTATAFALILNCSANFFALAFVTLALLGKSVSVAPGQTAVTDTGLFFNSYRNPRLKLSKKLYWLHRCLTREQPDRRHHCKHSVYKTVAFLIAEEKDRLMLQVYSY